MQAGQWERVQSIFDAVADVPRAQQEAAVRALCGDDPDSAVSVMALLEEDVAGPSLLDEGAGAVMNFLAQSALETDPFKSQGRRRIGPYRLLRVLGQGGMGIVYLAEREDIGGQVAIKLLRDAWLSPMRRERFAKEQHTLVKLNHPGIARIYDASSTDEGTPWFVMEFVEGLPLTDYVRERGASVRDDLQVFRDICEAVGYAHSHAVIHRDLKPSNILVTPTGGVKLLDFGIAKQLDPGEAGDHTITGLRLLTPAYAAPEQRSGETVGTFTDVYSLGVLVYELLAGRLPLRRSGDAEEILEPPSKAVRSSGMAGRGSRKLSRREWADLDVLCMTAVAHAPDRRYRSVDHLLHDIDAFLEGRVLQARPPSLSYRAGKFLRRNRWPVLGTASALLLLVGMSILFTVRLARSRDQALAEAVRTHRIQDFMLSMLSNADGEAGPAQDLKVTTVLDREAQHADLLRDDPETQVELEQTIGSMYDKLGNYEGSEQILSTALKQAEGAGQPVSSKMAAILVQLAALRTDRGDGAGAEAEIRQAEALARSQPTSVRNDVLVQAKIAMGRAYVQQGAYEQAILSLTPVADGHLPDAVVAPLDQRDALAALSVAQLGAHHYDLAEAASARAIEMDRRLLGDSHVQTGLDLINLASIKATRKRLLEAERLYREGLGIMSGWYGPENPDVITAKSILARTLVSERKDTEAAAILRDVLPLQEKAYGRDHPRVALTLLSLGDLAIRSGDFSLAETQYARAAAIYRATLGETSPSFAVTISGLGSVYLRQNKVGQAEPLLRQSVEALAVLPPGNALIGVARGRWGRALLRERHYTQAEEQLSLASRLMTAQPNLPVADVANVREDLAVVCQRVACPADLSPR